MAFIPVPGAVSVEAIFSMAGQTVENIYHYQQPGTPGVADLVDLGEAFITEWTNHQRAYVPTEVSLINVRVTDLDTANSPVVNVGTGLPLAGTQSGALLPNNVTLTFTKRTQFRGRSYRGRIYFPGLGEPNVTNNTVSGALVTAIRTGLNSMIMITTTLGVWEMVVVSRYTGGVPRINGIFSNVVAFTSDGTVDSMRRRLPGRGS